MSRPNYSDHEIRDAGDHNPHRNSRPTVRGVNGFFESGGGFVHASSSTSSAVTKTGSPAQSSQVGTAQSFV
jgi:hypothetical protein